MESKIEEAFESTMSVMSKINAVEGFDPRMVTACFRNENGESNMYLQAEPAMLWFRMKYPKGRLEQNVIRITDTSATIEGKVFDDEGVLLANAYATRYYSNTDQYGKDYIQNAGVSAVRKALGICGFGTPRDAEFIDGVTIVIEAEKAPEQPVDTGRSLNKFVVPPVPKTVTPEANGTGGVDAKNTVTTSGSPKIPVRRRRTASESTTETAHESEEKAIVNESEPVERPAVPAPVPSVVPKPPVETAESSTPPPPTNAIPKSLEDALRFVIPAGRFAGKTMKELLDAGEKDAIRFYLKPSYTGKPIQIAARMVAGQYNL